ncbi:MAG TPA: nucleotide exchange factor GrpE [Candidatus Methylomirabilis sp.]
MTPDDPTAKDLPLEVSEAPPQEGAAAGPAEGPGGFRTPEALLAEKDQEIGTLKDRLLRLQAEFENFKKRQARERAEFLKYAHEGLLREFLPILDNLERAVGSATDDAQPAAIRTGVEMIVRLFRTTLEKAGVTPMDCLGKAFDPNRMQAVLQVEAPEGTDGQVLEVVQQGYLLEGRVLRPAMVKVSRSPRPAESRDAGEPEA